MRRLLIALAMMVLSWPSPSPAWAGWNDPPDSPPAAAAEPAAAAGDPAIALEKGLDSERQRNWAAAIEVYRDALERWPSRVEFSRRLRLCEIHFKLHRRYSDASFRTILLALPRDQAVELYDEVLERIQSNYVDDVPMEPLVRHGIDNLEVALRDPVFVKANAPAAAPERLAWFRDDLRGYRANLAVPDRAAALRMALNCGEAGRQAIGLAATPVLLEFICGAFDALDDFSSYLTPDKLEDLYAMIDGNFVGLGIELKLDKEGLRLMNVLRGGPAWEARLHAGDTIVEVNGVSIKGMGLDEAANKLQGIEGSGIDLVVKKADGAPRALHLVRRHVDVESVIQAKVVDRAAGIGYLRLTGFQKTSTDELDAAIAGLSAKGMRILVLDLRGNPGGLLSVAVDMAGRFIDEGTIVTTRGRLRGQTQSFVAAGRARWRMPVYLLVDHDSASASEILAGALQDHQCATIVGARTYGKGSVQSIFSLRSAPAGLKLTTAKFYSPRNRPYSEQGVTPDLPVLVRSSAKPLDDTDRIREESNYGDPDHDPVLAAAIRAAGERHAAGR